MTGVDDASEVERCGSALADEGEQITKTGKDLVERAKNKPKG